MLGWLAHVFATVRPPTDSADGSICRCVVPMTGAELAARLPLLGSVLCLPARRAEHEEHSLPAGWLAARRELTPLLDTHELIVSSMIGVDGPREWIDCVDASGRFCARLHLLPDTDYLAWDALLARGRALPAAPVRADHLACRATRAELLYFRVRRLGPLSLLDTVPLGRLSLLGQGIAREVAKAAAVELEPAQG
ncbi:hypothetical protein [Dyella sp. 20L07]|uniref:hypothetical protein n=1 Tax=Dyella sp. 20L07 TaxID=3384240 RepID=UPI003D2E6EAA